MRGIFKIDGPFFKYGTILADIIILTILWILCSLPLITVGISTTALFYVTTKQVSNREGYVTANFLKSFKINFFQGLLITIILAVIGVIVFTSIRFSVLVPQLKEFILTLDYIAAFELIIVTLYIFPLMSRFDMKITELFKTAFFLANRHMFTTFTCLMLIIAIIFMCTFNPMFLFASIGIYAYISSFMLMRIFRKYCPDIDVDDESEIIG
ncbi:MAG: DUF624 domain-containing protein [Clostridiales bacterium]|nr:DUF624 domain-containing protein [Clostridiales bacterium]